MQLVPEIEATGERSPLAAARLHRQLTVEEAAARADLSTDEVEWLEKGRVYRFATTDDALVATVLYASALGIDHREAQGLAGLPVPPRPLARNPLGRAAGLGALAVALLALVCAVAFPRLLGSGRAAGRVSAARGPLEPAPWKVSVDVLNGSGDINYTRAVASRIGALAYRIDHVTSAARAASTTRAPRSTSSREAPRSPRRSRASSA